MQINLRAVAALAVLLLCLWQYWDHREATHRPGVIVPEEPQQTLESQQPSISYKDVVLDPLAQYTIRARILGRHRYVLDRLAKIAPVDLAVGWGVMSDTTLIKKLNISQDDRFYFYSWHGDLGVTPEEVAHSSANMHLIPANHFVEEQIEKIRVGQIATLRGHLVRIHFPDGSQAQSSLSRTDTGAGACEIMYVELITVANE